MFFCCIALLITIEGSVADTLWTEKTEHYSISVYYPAIALENVIIGDRLEEFASEKIQTFKDNLEEYFLDDPLMSDWYLEIRFTHEPSPDDIVCLLACVWDYTGGAHGNSWTQAFPFDLTTETFAGPVELLGGQTEFETFAEKVMLQLDEILIDEGWIENGASAVPENYHSVLPVPDEDGDIAGYLVIFPPYQVACYASGTVDVYVPLE